MRAIPQAAIDLVKQEEETHLFVYDDRHYPPRPAKPGDKIDGTLTAGTGHTGEDVVAGMVVTAEMDAAWLLADLGIAAKRLVDRIGDAIVEALTENQYAALLDFIFNMGANPAWTIWKRLKARHFDQVPGELTKFVNWGEPPQKSSDLVNRRNAESALWAQGEPGTTNAPVPSSVTRAAPTPPTPADPVPMVKSKALIAGAAGAVAGAGPIVNQVSQAITPYAEHSHYVQATLGILATVAAGCAAAGVYYIYVQKRNAQN